MTPGEIFHQFLHLRTVSEFYCKYWARIQVLPFGVVENYPVIWFYELCPERQRCVFGMLISVSHHMVRFIPHVSITLASFQHYTRPLLAFHSAAAAAAANKSNQLHGIQFWLLLICKKYCTHDAVGTFNVCSGEPSVGCTPVAMAAGFCYFCMLPLNATPTNSYAVVK